jgi:hypothetical protein
MSGHLKKKMSVPPLVQKLPGPRSFHRQSAKNKRAGGEAQILVRLLPLEPDTGDRIGTAELLF